MCKLLAFFLSLDFFSNFINLSELDKMLFFIYELIFPSLFLYNLEYDGSSSFYALPTILVMCDTPHNRKINKPKLLIIDRSILWNLFIPNGILHPGTVIQIILFVHTAKEEKLSFIARL